MSQIDQGNSDGPCWLRAPHELCDVLRAGIPRSSERVLAAVQAEIPEYHQPVSDEFGDELRAGVIAAIERFVDLIESGGNDALGPSRSLYYDLGRHELRSGRRLETLLGAYQIGARVAWQELVAACTRAEAEPELVYALAAAIFAYVQELSTASAQGYAAEQAAVAGATRAARHELVALLTSGGGA